ncbi:hypothetical protein [Candidatus Cytomitobacter primus]|nr:hypothetical protein [Candidatus Cytomitobacter primus]
MLLMANKSYAMENEEMDMMDETHQSIDDAYSEHTVYSEPLTVSKLAQLDPKSKPSTSELHFDIETIGTMSVCTDDSMSTSSSYSEFGTKQNDYKKKLSHKLKKEYARRSNDLLSKIKADSSKALKDNMMKILSNTANDETYYRSQIKEDRADDFAHITYMQKAELELLRKMENNLKSQLGDGIDSSHLSAIIKQLETEKYKSIQAECELGEKLEQLKLDLANEKNAHSKAKEQLNDAKQKIEAINEKDNAIAEQNATIEKLKLELQDKQNEFNDQIAKLQNEVTNLKVNKVNDNDKTDQSELGETNECIDKLETDKNLESQPNTEECEKIAKLYEHLGNSKRAAQLYQKAAEEHQKYESEHYIEKPPFKSAQLYEKAFQLYKSIGMYDEYTKMYKKAVELYEKAKQHEKVAELYLYNSQYEKAAEQYIKAGQSEKAAKQYENAHKCTEAAEQYIEAKQPLKAAELYIKANRYEKAAEQYIEAKQYGNTADLYKKAADLYIKAKQYEKAALFYEKAAEQYIKLAQEYTKIIQYEEGNGGQNATDATYYYSCTASNYEYSAQQYAHSAQQYTNAHQYEKAAKQYEKAAEQYECYSNVYEKIDLQHIASGYYSSSGFSVESLNYFRAQEADSNRKNKSEALQRVHAKQQYAYAAKQYANIAKQYEKTAEQYISVHKYTKAAEEYEKAADIYKDTAQRYKMNDIYVKAVKQYSNAMEQYKNSGEYEKAENMREKASEMEKLAKS